MNFDRLPLECRRTPTNGNDVWWRGYCIVLPTKMSDFASETNRSERGPMLTWPYPLLLLHDRSTEPLLCFDPKNKHQYATRPKPVVVSGERKSHKFRLNWSEFVFIYWHLKTPFILSLNLSLPISNFSCSLTINIIHHTAWRTWLFIAYSNERWLYCHFSLPHLYISL